MMQEKAKVKISKTKTKKARGSARQRAERA
jgi:hypothetical protein